MKTTWVIILCSLIITEIADASSKSSFEKSIDSIASDIQKKIPEKAVILVMPFTGVGDEVSPIGRYLSGQLQIALANKSVTVLERKSLETLLSEKKLLDTGLLDEATVVRIGKSLGAKVVIYGIAVESRTIIGISLKVVNIERGNTLGGINYEIKRSRAINSLIESIPDREEAKQVVNTEPKTNYSIGLSYLGTMPTDSKQFGTGAGGQAMFLYTMGDYFDFETVVGHFSEEIKQDKLPSGSLAMTSVQAGLRFKFLGDEQISPYMSAGLGLYYISHQEHDIGSNQINLCPDEKTSCPGNLNTAVGAYMGIGFDLHLNRSRTMTINFDARYAPVTSNTGEDVDPPPPNSRSFRIGGVMASGGFRYRY